MRSYYFYLDDRTIALSMIAVGFLCALPGLLSWRTILMVLGLALIRRGLMILQYRAYR